MNDPRGDRDYLARYIERAPLALAMERAQECRILSSKDFPRPILDLGCGDGLFADVFFTEPLDYGLDPDSDELERARATGRYRTLHRCGGDRIPLDDASVGTIVCNSVLEHIPDIEPILREARRIMEPGGKFYITLPTDRFEVNTWGALVFGRLGGARLAGAYRRFFNRFWRHYHCHDISGWRAIFEKAGFTVTESRLYDDRRQCLVNDALVPLSLPAFLAKRMLGRWSWFPALRRWASPLLLFFARHLLKPDTEPGPESAGLVFFELTR